MENINIDKLFFKYNEALKLLNAKFTKLYKENSNQIEENPIDHIKYRIKSKQSIKDKLKNKNNLTFTAENIEETLNDVAGIRIICPFLRDIETIINYIEKDSDITIIKIKNYIETPKINGYSSYHMIVSVPVLVEGITEYVKAEIQIRTLAMDVIASLDHKIRYKKDIINAEEIDQKLQTIINFVNLIDIDLNNFVQKKQSLIQHGLTSIQPFCTKNQFNLFLEKYKLALKEIEDSLNSIKNDYIQNGLISPIDHIKGRIKPLTSIVTKLMERNKDITFKNTENYINDIGAIKVVCSFLSDANEIIDIINNQSNFIVLDKQDYITNPKECGYASYHFVVAVPIENQRETTYAKIEIQVRTIIMDFWANIEHILCYKKQVDTATKEQLKKIASALRLIEYEMDALAQITIKQKNSSNITSVKKRKKITNNQN